MDYPKIFAKSVAAGICIGIGTAVQLSCDNKYIGAFLFSIGLFYICCFKLNLYTGRVGYIIEHQNKPNILLIWLGNLTGCLMCCIPLRIVRPEFAETASIIMKRKIQGGVFELIIEGVFCGIIMFFAVEGFVSHKDIIAKYLGILLSVPIFILCGFEHSIADMCYSIYMISSINTLKDSSLVVMAVSISNAVGAILINYLLTMNHKYQA